MTDSPCPPTFGLLPRPEGRRRSFVAASITNLILLGLCILIGMAAPTVITRHYEITQLIAPSLAPRVKNRRPPAPRKPVQEPKLKPVEAKLTAPPLPHVAPQITRTPMQRPALAAAMPAQNNLVRPSVRPVHLGDMFGVTPNPNAMHPATVAALGNPYGDMQGPAVAPHGVVKSAGIGDSMRAGAGGGGVAGKVRSAGIPGYAPASPGPVMASTEDQSKSVELISKPPVQYPAEARQLRADLGKLMSRYTPKPPEAMDGVSPRTRALLGSLGYLAPGPRAKIEGTAPDPKDRIHEFQLYEKATVYVYERRVSMAIATFQQILAADPKNVLARRDLGDCYLEQRSYTRARRELSQVLAAAPDDYMTQFELGVAEEHLGLWKEARDHFQSACRAAPESDQCRRELENVERKAK